MNRWERFSDKELRLVYVALMDKFSDKMHAQGMSDEITVEANRRGDERAKAILR